MTGSALEAAIVSVDGMAEGSPVLSSSEDEEQFPTGTGRSPLPSTPCSEGAGSTKA
eukprot:CAMPEP_0171259564 /NCGR_PEP_ID=MMETSP0790-20130122/54991_1 /TAXON_ID=2925 /ORGANISM="Alexandrium catenella, Strain OF101" /LENGTH=55 /DNA_ID=CAMNT_0011727839 /DNA_START=21 /DNA_END=185 /DNA_ORIENTATION=-